MGKKRSEKSNKSAAKLNIPALPQSQAPPPTPQGGGLNKKLLAFRTISTMLAYIPEEVSYELSTRKSDDPTERNHLLVLAAFATLGVVAKGVMAIVAKIEPSDPTVLKVVVTLSQASYKKIHAHPSAPPSAKSNFRSFLDLLFSENPPQNKNSESKRAEGSIKFTDVKASDNMNTIAHVTEYVDLCQSVDVEPSLATHLYILKQLLLMKPDANTKDCAEYLRRYVVATCHKKIRSRMDHKTMSLPFFEALGLVPRPIIFRKDIVPQASTPQEQINDKELLAFVALDLQAPPVSERPDAPELPMTNLLDAAEKSERNEPFELYSEATCDEFHGFLLLCLDYFKEALDALKACDRLSQDDPSKLSAQYETTLSQVIQLAMTLQYIIHGSALRRHLENIQDFLYKHYNFHSGFAGEMHLPKMRTATAPGEEQKDKQAVEARIKDEEEDGKEQNDGPAVEARIKDKEEDGNRDDNQDDNHDEDKGNEDDNDNDNDNDDNDNDDDNDDDDDDGDDSDLAAVQPNVRLEGGAPLPLWKTYRKWLKFLLVHFDSIDILVNHFSTVADHSDIDIQILEAPPIEQDAKMLPLKELFGNANFFPASDPNRPRSMKNKDLLKKLTGMLPTELDPIVKYSRGARKSLRRGRYKATIKSLVDIAELKVNPWSNIAKNLAEAYKTTTFPVLTAEVDESALSHLRKFAHDVESLCDSMMYLHRLHHEMSAFQGNLHCEAVLATVLSVPEENLPKLNAGNDTYSNLQDFSSIIGVSKDCCPVCAHLLHLLTEQRIVDDHPAPHFIVRGSHNTVTACSLPPWLPEHIVDAMNQHFGQQLRTKLLKFHGTLLRDRPASTGSNGLSLQEGEGQIRPRDKRYMRQATVASWIRSIQPAK